MHKEKNICDNLLRTLLKLEGKTKDTLNSRIDLVAMGIRRKLHPYQESHVVKTPPAWYVLKPAQRITFCKYLRGVKFPDGFAANLGSYITADGSKVQGRMKTHSCLVLLKRIIPAGLRGLVRPDLYEAVPKLGNFFWELCSRNLLYMSSNA